MVCALFDVTASAPKLLAEGSTCPENLVGATASGDVIDLWFGSAVARVSGRELDLTYFYATWTVPYGVP